MEEYGSKVEECYLVGNKILPENPKSAIDYYIDALNFLNEVSENKATEKDMSDLQKVFSALIAAANQFIKTYTYKNIVVATLEKILRSYVISVEHWNKKQRRLPCLDELKRDPVVTLLQQVSSGELRSRVQNCLGIIDVFQNTVFFAQDCKAELYARALKDETSNLVPEIECYISANDIEKKSSALIKAFNRLMKLSSSWDAVVDVFEKLLNFCLDNRLPGLNEINRHALAALYKKEDLPRPQRMRIQIYLKILSLLLREPDAKADFQLPAGRLQKDPVVLKAFAIYERALKSIPIVVIEEPQRSVVPVAVAAAEPPEKKVKVKVKPEVKESEIILPPVFAYINPDPPKRKAIEELEAQGQYEMVLKAYPYIMDRDDADFRGQGRCQEKLGRYRDALHSYLYIKDPTKHDHDNIERLKALAGASSYGLAQSPSRVAPPPSQPAFKSGSSPSASNNLANSN